MKKFEELNKEELQKIEGGFPFIIALVAIVAIGIGALIGYESNK